MYPRPSALCFTGPAGYDVPSEPHREPAPGISMTARPQHGTHLSVLSLVYI